MRQRVYARAPCTADPTAIDRAAWTGGLAERRCPVSAEDTLQVTGDINGGPVFEVRRHDLYPNRKTVAGQPCRCDRGREVCHAGQPGPHRLVAVRTWTAIHRDCA